MSVVSKFAWSCVLSILLLSGCAGRYVHSEVLHSDAKVRKSADANAIVALMESYERALSDLDMDTLRDMISSDYYENAGTTHTTEDDYGYDGVVALFQSIADHVVEARVDVKVREVRVYGDRADVLFEYAYTMHYNVGEARRWQTQRDVNRIQLQREGEDWRIVSGL